MGNHYFLSPSLESKFAWKYKASKIEGLLMDEGFSSLCTKFSWLAEALRSPEVLRCFKDIGLCSRLDQGYRYP